jgi:hypothetical protein
MFEKAAREMCKVDEIASKVSPSSQKRFYDTIKHQYRVQINGNTWKCFQWGWRVFKAMRSLLMSAALFSQSEESKDGILESLIYYAMYYSLFHVSFALICLHPHIEQNQLKKVGHNFLIREMENKFIRSGYVLPESFSSIFDEVRVLRDLTTYFAPLGGLSYTSFEPFKERNRHRTEVKSHLRLAFQLCGLMSVVLWDTQSECEKIHKSRCELYLQDADQQIKEHGQIIDEYMESLIKYPTFDYSTHGYDHERLGFDEQDAYMAIRKLGLLRACPKVFLPYETKTIGLEYFSEGWMKNEELYQRFHTFLFEVF